MCELLLTAFEDLILSIESKTKADQVAFDLVDGCNTNNNTDGNVTLAWKRLIQKYEAKTSPSYIQLKQDFASWKLEDVSKDQMNGSRF